MDEVFAALGGRWWLITQSSSADYIKHLFYIWKLWKWKLMDSCRSNPVYRGPRALNSLAIIHFPLSSLLWWKKKKVFSRRKLLCGSLAGFPQSWIILLFPDLWYETVNWNQVSAGLCQAGPVQTCRCQLLTWLCSGTGHRGHAMVAGRRWVCWSSAAQGHRDLPISKGRSGHLKLWAEVLSKTGQQLI